MKKLLTFVLFSFLLSNILTAQSHSWANIHLSQTRKYYIEFQQKQRDSIVKNNISKTVEYVKYYDKKGKLKRNAVSYERFYNILGDLIKENLYTEKGKLYRVKKYGYNTDGIETSYRNYNAKDKLLGGWDLSFNDKGLMSRATLYSKKEGNIAWIQTYEYNADSNAIKIQSRNKKDEITYTTEYEYYEDKQKKEVRSYNKKGKLKSVIKYDCIPTGMVSNGKKADTTTICYKDNIDEDGNTIYTTERMKQNGKIVRSITKISPDKKHSEITFIDHKGRLSKMTYTFGEDRLLKERTYYFSQNSKRNRLIRYTFNWSNDKKQYTTRQYGYKNRLVSERTAYFLLKNSITLITPRGHF